MTTKLSALGVMVALAVFAPSIAGTRAFQSGRDTVRIDRDDIGGVMSGPSGPEAGVWVIAETTDLPTRFVRIVVTDERGRYLVPDLPQAAYTVFVRGYGLVDSPRTKAAPGAIVNLKAVPVVHRCLCCETPPGGPKPGACM
jgi:hypothetical protein